MSNATVAYADGTYVGTASDGTEIYTYPEGDVPEHELAGLINEPQYTDLHEILEFDKPTFGTGETCAPKRTITVRNNLKNNWSEDWSDSIRNNTSTTQSFTLTTDVSTTWTYGFSATVSTSFKTLIFAEASAEINGNIAKSKTLNSGVSVPVVAPKQTMILVERGMWREKYSYSYYDRSRSCSVKRGSGNAWAPYRKQIRFTERKI